MSNPALASKINIDEVIERLAIAEGVKLEGLLISLDDQNAANEQGQSAEMMKTLAPELMKQAGPMIAQQMEGQPDGQQTA